MSHSQGLSKLRDLQALREHRSKSEHAQAVRSKREAAKGAEAAAAKLSAQYEALDHYASQGELHIDRFQIFAQLITQSEAELLARKDAQAEADEHEAHAAQMRVRAEKQSEQLATRHAQALTKERRKAEDKKSREFLSQAALSMGEKR